MADPDPAEDASNLRLNRRRAVILRWWLLAAVAIAVSSAPTLLDIALPRVPMFAVLALMAGFNAFLEWRARTREAVGAGELFGELCVDLAALAILLYLSGGAANPLISFLLVPVAVAALSLPGALTAAVAMLAVALYTLLMWQFLPLAVADAERATRLHLAGMWLTFVVSAAMIAWFVARMTASIRERDSRLATAREQALRDERVVALGALAAGAAHELGTPLATIAVLVGELEHDPSLDADARADLALVRDQVALCKGIISGMAQRGGAARAESLQAQDAGDWLRGVLARWQAMRPRPARPSMSLESWRVPAPGVRSSTGTGGRQPAQQRGRCRGRRDSHRTGLGRSLAAADNLRPGAGIRRAGTASRRPRGAAGQPRWRRHRPAAGVFRGRARGGGRIVTRQSRPPAAPGRPSNCRSRIRRNHGEHRSGMP
jgi:signal transduction histidine kinase